MKGFFKLSGLLLLTPIGCGVIFVLAFVVIVGLALPQLPAWAQKGVHDWMMDIPQNTGGFPIPGKHGRPGDAPDDSSGGGGDYNVPGVPDTGPIKGWAKLVYYTQTFKAMLAGTAGWWQNFDGHVFDDQMYLAIVLNYELSTMHNDPAARMYLAEAMARGCWNAIKTHGPDGCLWYLGGSQAVQRRVRAAVIAINEDDYDFAGAYQLAGLMLTNPDWQQGQQWNQPQAWGNPTWTADQIRKKIPAFWKALQNHNVGPGPNQILYISQDGQFFIVTQAQQFNLCKNSSCVSP